MARRYLKIGELAARTGISVRTLHHYEAKGLLSPDGRTEAGHRIYGPKALLRLQQIRALQGLGFSLRAIGELLAGEGGHADEILGRQVEVLRERVETLAGAIARVEGLRRLLAVGREPGAEDIIEVLTIMNRIDGHYTPDQREALRRQAASVGEARIREVEAEWPRLIAEVRAEMERGTDPSAARVQALARRWTALVEEFTGGDAAIASSLRRVYEQEPEARNMSGVDPALLEYVAKAWGASP
jgi:DNA-binding transcriptional MerR regulator